jgi:hypothetical protein
VGDLVDKYGNEQHKRRDRSNPPVEEITLSRIAVWEIS